MITFSVAPLEHAIILKIVDRAMGFFHADRRHDLMMDITATHANGCPLQLDQLLECEDFDFVHDIAVIRRHLDRETGHLKDCFVPRTAVQ